MIRFIIKGVIRDRSKSLFPFLVVSSGVMLTVFFYCWIKGAENEFVESSARFSTGHLKIMTRAYWKEADLIPNDLAYIGVSPLLRELKNDYPELFWTHRIRFSGLLDIPDEKGETKAQGPIAGIAIDLTSKSSPEYAITNLEKGLLMGEIPNGEKEILVTSELAKTLSLKPGNRATIITSTMTGSLAIADFMVSGIVRFGITPIDKGTVIADIIEISKSDDPDFLPVMLTLKQQSGLAELINMLRTYSSVVVAVFLAVMSVVLWNAGLMGSLRRYGEIGVRLAMGEEKRHLYFSLIGESLIIGAMGSIVGTGIGIAISYYLQVHGLNVENFMKRSTLMFGNVIRAEVTPLSFLIGFIPGLLATFLGTAIAGIGVFRRKKSTLMKEFET